MAGAETLSCVAMKEFVKQHVIPEIWVALKQLVVAIDGPVSIGIGQEEFEQPTR